MDLILFKFIVEPDEEDGGYTAYTPTLPGVVGQGETEMEAFEDLEAAMQFTLDDMVAKGEPLPESDESARNYPSLDEAKRTFRAELAV
jgi:predicted RNase H-like HicB family nuclease